MSVTGLQYITNLYPAQLAFKNTEASGNNRTIAAWAEISVGNAWIPWCTSAAQFASHHMVVSFAGLSFYVWQQDSTIRCTRDGWVEEAPAIAGNPAVGQSVAWVLDAGGQLTQVLFAG
jgi:hypothetical protein